MKLRILGARHREMQEDSDERWQIRGNNVREYGSQPARYRFGKDVFGCGSMIISKRLHFKFWTGNFLYNIRESFVLFIKLHWCDFFWLRSRKRHWIRISETSRGTNLTFLLKQRYKSNLIKWRIYSGSKHNRVWTVWNNCFWIYLLNYCLHCGEKCYVARTCNY